MKIPRIFFNKNLKYITIVFFLFQSLKSVNPERAAKLYNCVFCPGASFKWQSELYKHCVFKHFADDLCQELEQSFSDAKKAVARAAGESPEVSSDNPGLAINSFVSVFFLSKIIDLP